MKDKVHSSRIKKAPAIKLVSGHGDHDCHRLKTIIGRGPFCDLTLPSKHVSILHALIAYDFNGVIWVKDLGSSNGVFVNFIYFILVFYFALIAFAWWHLVVRRALVW